MTGIGGVKMWMEDWMINSSSYPKKYRENFIKIVALWKKCVNSFKSCKSIKACNNTCEEYTEEVDKLREEMYSIFGVKSIPIGISDCLDYFEEAVGDLEERALDKLTESGGKFTVALPEDEGEYIDDSLKYYKSTYPGLEFSKSRNTIKVSGNFWDVRSLLEEVYPDEIIEEIIDEGVFADA